MTLRRKDMLYTIHNERIEITVTDMGAELQSIRNLKNGKEYLWQGDPRFWTGRAYNLFPICGRLFEGKYTYRGKTYEMNLHGFARKTQYEMVDCQDQSITFRLLSDEKLKEQYPFDFELLLTYTLNNNTIETAFAVKNTGENDLIFAVGGHPGFRIPVEDGLDLNDFYLAFDEPASAQAIVMSDSCLYTGKMIDFPLRDEKYLNLQHDMFDHDAIFLHGMSHGVTLRSDKTEDAVHLSYPDMQYLGLWHAPKTNAPYICLEPWYSIPADDGVVDDLETKRDMIHLAPKKIYHNTFTISIQ